MVICARDWGIPLARELRADQWPTLCSSTLFYLLCSTVFLVAGRWIPHGSRGGPEESALLDLEGLVSHETMRRTRIV